MPIDLVRRDFVARTKVGLDYGALARAVESKGYPLDTNTDGALPSHSPSGKPWILWTGSRSNLFELGVGLDGNGTWWWITSDWKGRRAWISGSLSSAPSIEAQILEKVAEVTKNVILPALAVAATTIGGPTGIAAVAFITAVQRMASGASLSKAVISSTRDALPGLVATGMFDKTLTAAKEKGLAAVASLRSEIVTATELEAYEKARMLGTAIYAQRKSLDELKARIPEKAEVIDMAAAAQATPLDIASALEGREGVILMNAALERHAGGEGSEASGSSFVLPVVGGAAALALLYLLL